MGTPIFDYESVDGIAYISPGEVYHGHIIRDPKTIQVYLVGSGIASLAAATHLINDAHVTAENIHILESSPIAGGSMDAAGDADKGYIFRGGRMLNFSYVCLYELLDVIPSLTNPKKTVRAEIDEFNAIPGNKTNAHARLVCSTGQEGPTITNVKNLGLTFEEKADVIQLMVESEQSLTAESIEQHFPAVFFETDFWYIWATM